jgi:putative ATP-binding cassette transporter
MRSTAGTTTVRTRSSVRATLKSAWRLTAPFFKSDERWPALRLLVAVTMLTLVIVGTAVLFTYWQRGLFNALEAKDWNAFLALLLTWDRDADGVLTIGFVPLLAVFVGAMVYRLYLQQRLQLRWRAWMTTQFLDRYLTHQAYYRLTLDAGAADNPDQRISEDVNWFTEKSLELSVGLFENIVSVISFIILLWALSANVEFWGVSVPGSLVWIALIYALFGTALTHFIGRRLVPLSFYQQKLEADFRLSLIRLREHAESIAFYRGETREAGRTGRVFSGLLSNFAKIIDVTKSVTFSVTGLNQANLVFPLIIAAPAYFAGRIPLGGVFQTANALNKVVESLSWFIENYIKLADYSATIERLEGFDLDLSRNEATSRKVIFSTSRSPIMVACHDLSVFTPSGRVLLDEVDLSLGQKEWLLLTGHSGSGKTSLLRTISGLWPYASGNVELTGSKVAFMPQRSYFPDDALKAVLSYPEIDTAFDTAEMVEVLDALNLSNLSKSLEEIQPWMKVLSGGELQRLAIARVILQKPALLFCDEVTSHLDSDSEALAYSLMRERLQETSVISIGHRESIAHHHSRRINLSKCKIHELF